MKTLLALKIPGYTTPFNPPKGLPNIHPGPSDQNIIVFALQLLLVFAVALALITIILSGISWITSGGDKQKLEKARSRLIYAIVGLVLSLCAFLIVNLIGTLLNIKLLG